MSFTIFIMGEFLNLSDRQSVVAEIRVFINESRLFKYYKRKQLSSKRNVKLMEELYSYFLDK